MALSISYTEASAASPLGLAHRALRVLGLVASLWMVTGCALTFWPVQTITPLIHRLHLVGLACLLVGAGFFSAVLPLQAALRRHKREHGTLA